MTNLHACSYEHRKVYDLEKMPDIIKASFAVATGMDFDDPVTLEEFYEWALDAAMDEKEDKEVTKWLLDNGALDREKVLIRCY